MIILKSLRSLKQKLFATYEYNEGIDLINKNLGAIFEEIKFFKNEQASQKLSLQALTEGLSFTNDRLSLMSDEVESINNKCSLINRNLAEVDEYIKYSLATKKTNWKCDTKKAIKVCFLIHNVNAWHAVASVINKMQLDTRFIVYVVSINKNFPGQEGYSGEEDVHLLLEENNIEHIRCGMQDSMQALEIIASLEPDVIFRQSQWESDYPPALNSKYLSFTRLATIPYGIANIIDNAEYEGGIKNSAVDSLFHRRCFRVYCSSSLVKKKAEQDSVLKGKQFVVVGHPKLDYAKKLQPAWPFPEQGKKKVLWSPHHSVLKGWSDFGMFHIIWKDMLDLVRKNEDIDFVFCPHPALVTLLNSERSPLSQSEVMFFYDEWRECQNTFEYYGEEYLEVAASSDLIVTDGISMLLEGQLIQKDILFFDRVDRRSFNEIGDVLTRGFHNISTCDELQAYIDKLRVNSFPSLIKVQQESISDLFPLENNCADEIINDLAISLK